MTNQTILAAQKALRNAPKGVYDLQPRKPYDTFYSEGNHGVSDVLANCARAGYQALFMTELALARTEAEQGSELLTKWYLTPSVRVTGQTKAGAKVVVYAHIPSYLSDPANIRNAVESGKLVNGAGVMPQNQFERLVNLEDNVRVFVVDYETLKRSSSGVISLDSALEHPQTIPFLGGRQVAEKYLAKHREVYGSQIGVWHSDDFNKKTPLGRVLYLDYDYYYGLYGINYLDYDGQVFGVAPEAQAVAKKLEHKI